MKELVEKLTCDEIEMLLSDFIKFCVDVKGHKFGVGEHLVNKFITHLKCSKFEKKYDFSSLLNSVDAWNVLIDYFSWCSDKNYDPNLNTVLMEYKKERIDKG